MAAAATVQGSVGFGLGLLSSPILALIDPSLVPGSVLFCGLVMALLVVRREHRAMDVAGVKWGLVGRFLGSLVAAAVLASLPKQETTVVLGGLVILAVLLSASGLRVRLTLWSFIGAGALSGFMSTVASSGGPPFVLLYQGAPGARLRSTMSAFFVVGTIISIAALAVVGRFGLTELLSSLVLLPGVVVGFVLSKRTLAFLDRGYTRTAVLAVSAIAGLALILRHVL
jgi:uncharacterized membrane protein YfcA